MKKYLIVRFSSIGDIVLTSPVIRVLASTGRYEIHYLTKRQFAPLLAANPYISKVISIESSISEVIPMLKAEKYDFIIDLHRNIRTTLLLFALMRPFRRFRKLNIRKWLLVRFKWNLMPQRHIVDRYLDTVSDKAGNDGLGLDHFIPADDEINLAVTYPSLVNGYYCFTVGSRHATKQMPVSLIVSIIRDLDLPVVLLGGEEDYLKAEEIRQACPNKTVLNLCGSLNINRSASIIGQSNALITSDSGLMHIACALKKRVISVWGSTVPDFGMSPYLPTSLSHLSTIVQVIGLDCRPCSKLGFPSCPKGHFKCMLDIEADQIIKEL